MERPPVPAYTPLSAPRTLYNRIANTHETPTRQLITKFIIPPRSGQAWHVPAGSIFRLTTPEGPQVGDLNVWSATNPNERFWAARTRQLQGSHVIEGDRLWSCLPYLRPLCGVVRENCGLGEREEKSELKWEQPELKDRGPHTKWGGRCHDLLGTRCDPYGKSGFFDDSIKHSSTSTDSWPVNVLLTGTTADHHCHSNLVRAVSVPPFCHPSLPLPESAIHDVLNVFQVTGLDPQGRYFMEASPATPDSFIEFFAEQDLICALSTCPGGDLSKWGWGEGDGMLGDCRPIGVEVWEIKEEERSRVLEGWTPPECPVYNGNHGIVKDKA